MKNTEREKVIFCKRCLYSSKHPLGITFNDLGICSGCEIHDEKYTLNFTNTKARYITKSPRDASEKEVKNHLRFYNSEISWIKGNKLFRN